MALTGCFMARLLPRMLPNFQFAFLYGVMYNASDCQIHILGGTEMQVLEVASIEVEAVRAL